MSLDQKRHSIGPAAYWKKFVSQSAFPDTQQEIWQLTCGANIEQQQEQLITSFKKTVLLDVMNQLASSTDLGYGLYKEKWLCLLLLRLGGTFEEAPLPNLRQAHDLILPVIRHNDYGEFSDVQNNRPMIVTGNKGRPKIYISRNRLG